MEKQFRILFVDDEYSNLELFEAIFSSKYEVITARDGYEGLKIIKSMEIDLIISDMMMPGISGIDLLEKALNINPIIPRILLTAYGNFEQTKEAINRCKIYYFIQKPWDNNSLSLIIEQALKSHKYEKENLKLNEELKEKARKLEKELHVKTRMLEEQVRIEKEKYLSDEAKHISESKFREFIAFSQQAYYRLEIQPPLPLDLSQTKMFNWFIENAILVECNDAYARMHGYKSIDKCEKHPYSKLFKNKLDYAQLFFKNFIENKYILDNVEIRWEDENNETKWCLCMANSTIEDNHLIEIKGSHFDITERKANEIALIKSEEQYRFLAENTKDVIWTMDINGVFRYVSPSILRMTGYAPSDGENKKGLIDILTPESSKIAKEILRSEKVGILKGKIDKKAKSYVLEHQKKDGSSFWAEVVVNKAFDAQGNFLFFLGVTRDITERVNAEKELRISEEKFSTLFQLSPEPVLLTKQETGIIIDLNEQFCTLMGLPKEKIVSKSTIEIGFWANNSDRQKFLNAVSKSKNVVYFEATIRATNNEKKDCIITAKEIMLRNETYMFGIIRDITSQKMSDLALKESEKRFRNIYENSVVGYYRIRLNGDLLMANNTLLRMLGYTDLIEFIDFGILNSGLLSNKTIPTFIKKIKQEGKIIDLETKLHKKDNTTIFVSESLNANYTETGDIEYINGTVVNISPRKEAEQKLRHSEELFKAITEQTTDGIALINKDGSIVLSNNAFSEITGYTTNELLKTNLSQLIETDAKPPLVQTILSEGKATREIQLRRKNATKYYAEIKGNKVVIGERQLLLILVSDITERYEAEKALRRSEAKLREAQRLAHIGSWSIDYQTNEIEWSEEIYRIMGKDSRKFKPNIQNVFSIIYPDDREELKRNFNLCKETNSKFEYTHRIIKDNGDIRYVIEHGRTTFNRDNAPRRTFGSLQDITDIKTAEEEIKKLNENLELKVEQRTHEYQESENKFRNLLQFIPDGIILVESSGKIQLVNKQIEKIFGFPPNELVNKSISKLIPKRFWEKHQSYIKNFFKSPTDREMGVGLETSGINKAGEEFPVDIMLGSVQIDNKTHGISIIRDITERKKNETELLKLSQSLEQNPATILITDKEGKIEYINKAFTEVNGYLLEEVLGQNPRILKADFFPDEYYQTLWETILSGEVWKGDLFNKRKNGETYWSRASLAPIYNTKKKITNFIGISYDITEDKKKEELLKFTTYAVDNAADAAYWIELNTNKLVFVNKSGWSILGYDKNEISNLSIFDIDPGLLDDNKWDSKLKELKTNKTLIYESSHKRKDGIFFPVEVTMNNFMYNNEEYLIAFSRDITEKKLAQKELDNALLVAKLANKTKSEFLANMSHEIRTPLNAVLGISDILHQQIQDKTHLSYLNTIKSSGKILLTLINDILDLSKIEAGKLELVNSFFSIDYLMEEIKEAFALPVAQKGLQFSIYIDPNIPSTILMDEIRLRQILTNLIGNSVKFTEKGKISVGINLLSENEADKNCSLEFTVEDSGIGIPESFLEEIFTPFTQQDRQDSKKYGGTGLGLTITKRLVEMLGGNILVKSKKNEGTLFTLAFKNIKCECFILTEKAEQAENINKGSFLPCKILIVDDIVENRKYLVGAFRNSQITVFEAKNGNEALNLAYEILPDLIITDLKMPVLDGFLLSEKIKSSKELKHIPIIANSAAVMSITPSEIKGAFFDEFIPKPIQLAGLYKLLTKYLPYETHTNKSKQEPPKSIETQKTNSKIIKKLKEDTWDLYQKLLVQQKIKDVEEFANTINQFAVDEDIKSLSIYSSQINNAVRAFDVDKIIQLIKHYPTLIDEL